MEAIELQIAAQSVTGIPTDKPLAERVAYAMRYVREHERDIFWMSARVTEDAMLRAALAAVMLSGNEDDRELIKRSLKPMQMLSAAANGIPVDFSQMETEGLLPLIGLWNDSDPKRADAT